MTKHTWTLLSLLYVSRLAYSLVLAGQGEGLHALNLTSRPLQENPTPSFREQNSTVGDATKVFPASLYLGFGINMLNVNALDLKSVRSQA